MTRLALKVLHLWLEPTLMKKYNSLAELIIDYRSFKKMTQLDLAVLLGVDSRTVNRWEKGSTLLNSEIRNGVTQKLHIPHQVIHNLNSTVPIPIYYDIQYHTYSLDAINRTVPNASWFTSELPREEGRVEYLSEATDVEVFDSIQEMRVSKKRLSIELLRSAINALPELNLMMHDLSGYYAGHLVVLKLRYDIYQKIRNREISEDKIDATHISSIKNNDDPTVFYLYLHNADSFSNAYYLLNRMFAYFKKNEIGNYIFAVTETKESTLELFRQTGLKTVWVDEENPKGSVTLLEGVFDMFLFGKMR